MVSLPLALTLVLAASDQYSLVVARRLGVDPARAQELTAALGVELNDLSSASLGKQVPLTATAETLAKAGFPDTSVCNGASSCVASLAKLSGLGRLVAVQLVKIGANVAVDVSVVDSATGTTLAAATRSVPLKSPRKELELLARELVGKLPPPEVAKVEPVKPPPTDVPKDTTLTPKDPPPPEPPIVVAEAPGMPTGRKVALGLGAGAVVSLGVGIGLGASALAQSSSLSALDPDYEAKAAAVKGRALAADLSYGLAAGLAVAAVVTWLMSPPEPTPAR
jgi:hypothetical protein